MEPLLIFTPFPGAANNTVVNQQYCPLPPPTQEGRATVATSDFGLCFRGLTRNTRFYLAIWPPFALPGKAVVR